MLIDVDSLPRSLDRDWS